MKFLTRNWKNTQKCENGITGEIFHPHPFEGRMNESFRFRSSLGPIPFVRE